MNRTEQLKFTRDLCRGIQGYVECKIRSGEVPAEWDGHELRCLIADKAAYDASISSIRKSPRHARALAYKNTILTTNLL